MKIAIVKCWLGKSSAAAAISIAALVFPGVSRGADLARIYAPYQALLERHLVERQLPRGGLISAFDYRAALASPKRMGLLEAQRQRLARFDTCGLDDRAPALAFWINAYNYFMLDHLLTHPADGGIPVDSVRDYGSLLNPYAVFQRKLFDIGGREYSLQEIELEVLLGEAFAERGWKDARVHFMVNCASVGCPPLRAHIYTAGNVEAMLAENTRRALDTPLHLKLDGNTLRVTSLFDWYADDFVAQSGSAREFIGEFGSARARERLRTAEGIEFIDYDWSLNSPENFEPVLRELGAEPLD